MFGNDANLCIWISLAWAFLICCMVDSVFVLKIQEGRGGLNLTVPDVINILSYLEKFPMFYRTLQFGCAK